MKEVISYRQWNMMDEFYNVNDAKEALCYVSTDFDKEIKYAREESRTGCRIFDREFVLPDYVQSFQGSVRLPLRLQMIMDHEKEKEDKASKVTEGNNDDVDITETDNDEEEIYDNDNEDDEEDDSENESEEQVRQRIMKQREEDKRRREMEEEERQALLLSVERFTIPEILFRPSDIEMKQLGLAETIVKSIESCDPIYHAAMYHNIILTGGNINIPNFKERLELELRSVAPIEYKIRIHVPLDPVGFAFEGAQDMIRHDGFISGLDRADWEIAKQSGVGGNTWNSTQTDANSNDEFTII